MADKSTRLIQSVQRALNIIECFDSRDKQLSLSEISERVDLNISTTHGLLQTLLANSYINKAPETGKYKLGLKFLEKGILVSEGLDLREAGRPYLKRITDKYQETSHLCIYQDGEIYCIDKMESPQAYLIMSSKVGRKLPIHATASGKVILANLSEKELLIANAHNDLIKLTNNTLTEIQEIKGVLGTIIDQGYAIENEETEMGAYSIAAPIRNYKGQVFGSISISGPIVRIKDHQEEIITDLKIMAASISRELGYKNEE